MKASTLFLLINLLFVSCTQKKLNPAVCGKSDPVSELPWLKEFVKKKTEPPKSGGLYPFSLTAFEFEGQTVIADESVIYSAPYAYNYNCDGSKAIAMGEHEKYVRERKKIRVLYEFDGKKAK